jgi:DNA-binding IclR family transcriptional regulator
MVATNGRTARQRQAERYSIGAVENALALLGAIAERDVLGLGEAAEIAGVSKSTAYRLLATLEVAGLAERLPESGYRAGVEAIRWASRLLAGLDVRTVALPTLRRLRDETGETVNLALLRDSSLVYVEILESPAAFRMADVPGSAVPIHATALGKAVAVHLEPQQLATILGPEPYERFTAATPTTWQAFNASLAPTRTTGYGVDLEEVSVGVACVGAAVLDGGRVVGALSVSAPRARMTDARIEEVGRRLVAVAAEVSMRLAPHPDEISRSATSPR